MHGRELRCTIPSARSFETAILFGTAFASIVERGGVCGYPPNLESQNMPSHLCTRLCAKRLVITGGMLVGAVCTVLAPRSSPGATVLSVDFASGYTNGNLVGQNSWSQTSTGTTSPIQVTSGSAIIGNSGQDVYKPFSTVVTPAPSDYLLTRIDFVVTAVQANGDYFFHVSDPVGTTSGFYQRLFARSASGSAQFGIATTSTSTAYPASFGVGTFALNQSVTAVMKWNFISGTGNDTIDLYLNPLDPSNPSGSPYATGTGWSAAEPTAISAGNFRQGSSSVAPSVGVSGLEVAVVPEPGTIELSAIAFAAVGVIRMRYRRMTRDARWS